MLLDNTKNGFTLKSNFELKKAYFLFRIISNKSLTNIGKKALQIALKLRLPILFLVKRTVFEQFCSGESLDDSFETVQRLYDKNVKSYLSYSVEGLENEKSYDLSLKEVLNSIEFVANNNIIDFTVFKPTAIANSKILQKVSEKKILDEKENELYGKALERFDTICNLAHKKGVKMLVDAEESWIQDPIDEIVLKMMMKYNKHEAIIYNTAQMYRHDRLNYLNRLKNIAEKEKFFIGIKLVRGAYIEQENKRAIKNNYKSPICDSKNLTDTNFNNGASFILSNLNIFSLFSGTHNEESIYKIIDIMKLNNINKNNSKIWFGQLYGMSDNISFNLANKGFNAIKYLPFGPIKEVIPYLIRRAEENTSVKGQTSRELELIKTELKRRKSI
ncbi:MAG: proline dehydrogenase [Cryomorphaceae bacterium]|nr:proline dehydrogenase [Cryomorphaceae bacterium]MBT6934832.1 proline dehydrogenase [Cryomorphaceae bacterium]